MQKQSKNWPGVQYPLNMRSTSTFKLLFVHPKDKKNNLETIKIIYEVGMQ